MSLRIQWALPPLMLVLMGCYSYLALPPRGATMLQHLCYPLAHAGWLHWMLNSLAWMFLWRLVTVARLLMAWLVAVAVGFLYPMWGTEPLCGFSVIIFFFLGFLLIRMRSSQCWQILIPVLVSFFIPHIAAAVHVLALAAGYLYALLRRLLIINS